MAPRGLPTEVAYDFEARAGIAERYASIEGECGSQQAWVSRTIYPSSRRRAYHVLASDHSMEANIACKEVRPRPAA
jgi:hypothetical protein